MKYRIFSLGENSLTIDFGNAISPALNKKVILLAEKVSNDDPDWLIEVVPAYSSLTIFYDLLKVRKKNPELASASDAIKDYVAGVVKNIGKAVSRKARLVEIPVCYDEEFAPDLEKISKLKKLSIDKIISIHFSATYQVFMLGFLPGFAYMGEVDKRIVVPRLENPRTNVAKGSVGIAGPQTGIYPLESPGGWRIIGRTPLDLFTPNGDRLTLLKAGDTVKFYPISKQEFKKAAG